MLVSCILRGNGYDITINGRAFRSIAFTRKLAIRKAIYLYSLGA